MSEQASNMSLFTVFISYIICYNKKYKNLGYYKTKEDAYNARCNFEKNHGIQNRYL